MTWLNVIAIGSNGRIIPVVGTAAPAFWNFWMVLFDRSTLRPIFAAEPRIPLPTTGATPFVLTPLLT